MSPAARRAARLVAASGIAVLAAAAVACSDDDPGPASTGSSGSSTCPDAVPRECPSSPPTYARDVAPVIASSCAVCHTPGGANPSRLLTTYEQVYAQRTAVLSQVASCRMPPPDAGPLTEEGRKALLTWLVCGAKND